MVVKNYNTRHHMGRVPNPTVKTWVVSKVEYNYVTTIELSPGLYAGAENAQLRALWQREVRMNFVRPQGDAFALKKLGYDPEREPTYVTALWGKWGKPMDVHR
jgi:hypothetical protein